MQKRFVPLTVWLIVWLTALWLVGCGDGTETAVTPPSDEHTNTEQLTLPTLAAADLNGSKLRVVATTSIIGDVVAQVGGEAIDLTILMAPGQDPHSYEPATDQLTAVSRTHVLFVNGWNLEERLLDSLTNIAEQATIVPVSAGITPLAPSGTVHADEADHADEEHDHGNIDPHVWFDPTAVQQWVTNIAQTLATLDPANATTYQANATAYQTTLDTLSADIETQFATIPPAQRVLVTNHDTFTYLAHRYGFEILGTVIPSFSTLAETSAGNLSDLIQDMQTAGVCTLFTENTVNPQLAETVAAELTDCPTVQILPLYTDALGPAGSGADSYLGMMQANVTTIVNGLK